MDTAEALQVLNLPPDAAPIEEMADFPEALSCETAGRRR